VGFLEDWARNGGKRPDKLGRFTIAADKWDVRRFEQMLEEMRSFDAERYALCETVETGNGMWADAFNAFMKVDPKLVDPGELNPRYLLNRQVMDEAQDLGEFTRLKQWTEGDQVAAAGACIAIRPDLEQLYDKAKTQDEKAKELEQKMIELAQAQAELDDIDRDLDELYEDWDIEPPQPEQDQAGQDSQCQFCGAEIEQDEQGAWVDDTGGDGCPGDDEGNNDNGTHQPGEGQGGEGEGEGGQGEGEGEGQGSGTADQPGGEGHGDGEGEGQPTDQPGKGKRPSKKPGRRRGRGKGPKNQAEAERKASDYQKQKQLIAAQKARLEAELNRLGKDLEQELEENRSGVRQIMKAALAKAADEYEAMNAVAQMWGLDPGELIRLPAEKRLELAKRLNNERFKRMADMFGPMERLMHMEQRRRVNDIPEEVYDVGIGADLERLLPTEYAKLLHPMRRLEFYKDFTEGRLQQYEMRGHDNVARGGIVLCLDNSGSMQGDRELWGKAVALCLLHLSREQKRNFYGIHFGSSYEIMEFDFEQEGYDLDRIIEYAEFFFNGGTDFMRPLSVALDKLKAEFAAKGAVDADIVFITDGQCGVDEAWKTEFLSEIERIEAQVWGILIDETSRKATEPLNELCGGKVATVKEILSGEDITKIFGGVGRE
jgi:uncharacterized protein with von Willebrand factor type A (vWA) domain